MPTSEVRTQIYLPRRLHTALKRAARARGVSMAKLLRDAAEDLLRRSDGPAPDPLADLIGIVQDDATDFAENHDRYLYGMASKRA